MNKGAKNILGFMLLVLVFAYYFQAVKNIWNTPRSTQWDFKIYYYAGDAYNQGLDPYLRDNLELVSGDDFWLHFAYPPLSLELLRLFPQVDYETGRRIWLVLKILSLVAIVFVWKRFFLRDISLFLIIPFMLFAFDGTVFWDLKSGNISIFEQLILWSAFVAFLKGRKVLFVLLALAGSMLKLPLALFMCLLIPMKGDKRWWWLAGGLSCVAVLGAVNYFLRPELFRSFMDNLQFLNERARDYNYSTLALWDDVFDSAAWTKHLASRMLLVYLGYALSALAVVLITVRGYLRLRSREYVDLNVFTVLFFCCSYAMVVPRMKAYSLIILIPAFLWLLSSVRTDRFAAMIIPLALIPVATPFFEAETIARFFRYYPLFLSFLIWLYFVKICFEPERAGDNMNPAGGKLLFTK